MALIAYFKFQSPDSETVYDVDVVPESSPDIVSGDLKTYLATKHGATPLEPGKIMFSNETAGIYAPVIMILAVLETPSGESDTSVVFHLSDLSPYYRINEA